MNKRTSLLALTAMMTAFATQAATAADLAPPPPPPAAPEIRASVSDWTGPYLGAVAGGTCAEADMDALVDSDRDGNIDATFGSFPNNGCTWTGGFMAGFNYQIDNVILGIEGDITWGGQLGNTRTLINATPTEYQRDTFEQEWQLSIRARLGVLTTADTLLYVTGGLSWLKGEFEASVEGPNPFSATDTNTHRGYVIGGGIEHAISENLHLRAEYLYASYNSKTYGAFDPGAPNPIVSARYKPDDVHTFRMGVSWNFPISQW